VSKEQSQNTNSNNQINKFWHAINSTKVISTLEVDREHGLSAAEVEKRINSYGKNELQEAPPISIWVKIYEQFANFLVILLLVAAVISAVLGDWVEAAAIMTIDRSPECRPGCGPGEQGRRSSGCPEEDGLSGCQCAS